MDSRLKGFFIESKNIQNEFGRRSYDRPKLEVSYEQLPKQNLQGLLFFVISGLNMTFNIINLYMDRF